MCPVNGAFALIMGIISGYPTGAKIVTDFYERGICTKTESERLLTFTNNSGPLFIIGTVGITLFGDTRTGILLLITHILSCLTVGFLFRFWNNSKIYKTYTTPTINKKQNSAKTLVSFSNLGEIISQSILKAINTIILIGGFVVFFSVILSILKQTHIFDAIFNIFKPILQSFNINTSFFTAFFTGIIELTNGVNEIAQIHCKNISINIIISSFLLGFGGISILLQVWSIISKTNLSIYPYFVGKLLQGCFSAFYTWLLLKYSLFFNLDLQPVFANYTNNISSNNWIGLFLILSCLLFLICVLFKNFMIRIKKR